MIVVGELPKSVTAASISSNKILVLLFQGVRIEEDIQAYDPKITYIITDKPRESLESLVTAGYYAIKYDTGIYDLSVELIQEFLNTEYDMHKLAYKSRRLNELYKNKLSIYNAIHTILISLRNRDLSTFYTAVKYNLNSTIRELDSIRDIVELSKDFDGIQQRFRDYETEISKLTGELQQSNSEGFVAAQGQLLNLQKQLDQKQQEIDILKNDNHELASQVTSLAVTSNETVPVAKYNSLLQDKQICDNRISVLETERDNLKQQLEGLGINSAEQTGVFSNAALIASLKHELELTKSVSPMERIEKMLPVITDDTVLKTPYVLQLKEVKPIIYLNSLIQWVQVYLRVNMIRAEKKAPLIIIFDNLMDNFRVAKYKKHGYAINSAPNLPNMVVVTNDLSLLFLKETIKIQNFNFIMVVDRLGSFKSVARSKKTITYYLVDSPSDIDDFNLEPNSCIGFYGDDGSCMYYTEPSPQIAALGGDLRIARIGQNAWMEKILRGLGIYNKS